MCDGLQRTQYGLWSTVLSATVQVVLTVVFVYPKAMGIGFLGMAAARSCAGLVQLIAIIIMIKRGGIASQVWGLGAAPRKGQSEVVQQTWSQRKWEVFSSKALWHYLTVAVPAAIIWWLEW